MLQVRNVKKKYQTGTLVQQALDGVSLNLRDCEFVAILGPSGSGKTTLLNVIGGLDRYDSGELIINGLTTRKYKDSDWDYYRNHTIGFVFQSYNLIPHQTLLANVELALTISGVSGKERRTRALKALEEVGLKEQAHKKPSQLSGGQMQRVAIARALVNDPDIVLADEPTGALDSETSIQVMNLLQEVAKDRLVVMVTHNPELARQYATRIVTIKDGKLIGDTNPYELKEEEKQEGIVKRNGRSSMSFLTALSLSFNNLLTKKARTFLVSAAGSIGIIGIALIMSLSSGANAYIASIQKEAMAEYPLQITSVGYNLASIMSSVSSDIQENAESAKNASSKQDDTVGVVDTVSSMFSGMSDNDLRALKKFLDSDDSGIDQYARSIRYIYNVQPEIYQIEDDGYFRVNPSPYAMTSSSSGSSSMMSMSGMSGVFSELPSDSSLYLDQYDVRAGHWPENKNECVLVLTDGGMVTDTLLYTLGLRDRSEMSAMMQALQTGGNVSVSDDTSTYTYDSFLGIRFKAVSPASLYQYDEAHGIYTSFANDTAKLDALLDGREDLTIVGVVQPKADSDTALLTNGICYSSDLTAAMMQEAADSSVVKAQLADPDINVFTGKSFADENASSDFSMEDLFTVDENALKEAFSFNPSALSPDTSSLSSPDLSGIDTSGMIDPDALSAAMPSISREDIEKIISAAHITVSTDQLSSLFEKLMQGYDTSVLESYAEGISGYLATDDAAEAIRTFLASIMSQEAADKLKPENLSAMVEAVMEGYPEFAAKQQDPTDFRTNLKAYLSSDEASALISSQSSELIQAFQSLNISEDDLKTLMKSLSEGYQKYAEENGTMTTEEMTASFTDYLNSDSVQQEILNTVASMVDTDAVSKAFTDVLQSSMASFTKTLSAEISSGMQNIMAQVSSSLQNSMVSMMSSMTSDLGSMFKVDPEAFAKAIKVSMSASDLQSLLSSLMDTGTSSYDSNLKTLGYADPDSPEEIDIYPVDFEAKSEITSILDSYNQRMKDAGEDDKVIIYTDLVAAMMSSVTTIVDTISYVLIAFVAISLIVSSIMIGVITYISVLERRKEIGILRALGASKHNVAQVFNAETFITGLLAGVIGVGVACLILIPGNAVIHAIAGNNDINAQLPLAAGAGLILLSIILTIIAGLLPSRKAANSDPVTALRTE